MTAVNIYKGKIAHIYKKIYIYIHVLWINNEKCQITRVLAAAKVELNKKKTSFLYFY